MTQYLQGSVVRSVVQFRDEVTKVAVDPATVEFCYKILGQSPTSPWTYTNATVPAVGIIARLGVGNYEAQIDTTSFIGKTLEMWDGLGTGQAPGDRWFEVIARGSE